MDIPSRHLQALVQSKIHTLHVSSEQAEVISSQSGEKPVR